MARLSLKSIAAPGRPVYDLVATLADQLGGNFSIQDDKGRILFGAHDSTGNNFPIIVNEEVLGCVKGEPQSEVIATLLSTFLQKEDEKKNLGSEVLNLYQEINLIFNFSEKLAQTIDPVHIAEVTLKEAVHSIKSDNGVVALWNEGERKLQVVARSGELFFHEESINTHIQFLSKIILSGQSEIMTDIVPLKENEIILPEVSSVMYAALKVKHRVMGAIILASNRSGQYSAGNLKLLTTLALQSSSAIESALLYEQNIQQVKAREEAMRRVHEATQKFVPHEFIRSLGYNLITDVKLGDQVEKIVTVLFADIREFTTISESMTPEENFSFICEFNECVGPIIRMHNGFVNHYLGDAIMALFPENAADALSAAVDMQIAIQAFNKERVLRNQPAIQIGIGMHTGPLIMGITGDKDRLDATTISDTVNTAARLESLTKYYKANTIVSEDSLRQVDSLKTFNLRHLGIVQLKGKNASVSIHECFSGNEEAILEKKKASLDLFLNGISKYLRSSFDDAATSFRGVLEINPEDKTALHFLNSSKHYIENGAPANWMGVERMANK